MPNPLQLSRDFFERDTRQVARELLGSLIVRLEGGQRLSGVIVETEAYIGEEDQACHARAGRTKRTDAMYGPAGHAYVYFTYGNHWMLNFVTEQEGSPAAVLLRAIVPLEGLAVIRSRRGTQQRKHWTDGPGKICQALNIDRSFYGYDLCSRKAELFLEKGEPIQDADVAVGPRVGLNTTPEPWKSKPWRYLVRMKESKNNGATT